MNFEDDKLSLDSFEVRAVKESLEMDIYDELKDKTLIYKETNFYHYRDCNTCGIQRLPKASHCATCNNCVKGYDHHCTLLNNCVGKRTLRVFILLLIFTWAFYLLSGVLAGIATLYEPYYWEY